MTEAYSGDELPGKSPNAAPASRRSSAEIERDIETTLQQIDRSLSAIEDKFDIRRAFGPLRDFLSTPHGKVLATALVVTLARRRPLLTCAAGIVYFYYRSHSESGMPSEETPMSEKEKDPTKKEGYLGFEQDPLKGPQIKEPIMAVEAGSETVEDGEYRCEGCGHRTYMEKSIIIPACPDCGERRFMKQSD